MLVRDGEQIEVFPSLKTMKHKGWGWAIRSNAQLLRSRMCAYPATPLFIGYAVLSVNLRILKLYFDNLSSTT